MCNRSFIHQLSTHHELLLVDCCTLTASFLDCPRLFLFLISLCCRLRHHHGNNTTQITQCVTGRKKKHYLLLILLLHLCQLLTVHLLEVVVVSPVIEELLHVWRGGQKDKQSKLGSCLQNCAKLIRPNGSTDNAFQEAKDRGHFGVCYTHHSQQ